MSRGKGRPSGTVGQLRQAFLMQVSSRHRSRCSARSAHAEHCCWEVSSAPGSQLLCNDLLRDPPSLFGRHRAPQQWQQLGLLSVLHPSPIQVGSDAEPKEVRALCIVMPAPGIFIIDFIATVIFIFFSLQFYLWDWRDADLLERVLHFQKGFFEGQGRRSWKMWSGHSMKLCCQPVVSIAPEILWYGLKQQEKKKKVLPVKVKNVNSGVILAQKLGCLRGLEATDWKAWKHDSPF